MNVEAWDPARHMSTVLGWWHSRHGIDFAPELLPTTGYLALTDTTPIAACFIYLTNSKVALIGWPITNPESSKQERHVSLMLLFDILHKVAKEAGCTLVMSYSGVPAIQKRLSDLGYLEGDMEVKQYVKGIV